MHWKDLPYAIYPDPEKACFSGSTWVEDDRVLAMYHGTEQGNMIAISEDPLLLNWKKIKNGPVIPMSNPTKDPYKVFDPFIWKSGEYYYSLSGSIAKDSLLNTRKRAHYLFKSKNLLDWKYQHEFVEDDTFTKIGDDGACPYFWPIGDKYILLFFSHNTGGQYILGNYDQKRQKLKAESHGRFNFGASRPSAVHAPTAAPLEDGVVAIFNINKGKNTNGWNQIMSLPRKLTLDTDGSLGIVPVDGLKSLRGTNDSLKEIELPINKEVVWPEFKGNSIEIEADIDLGDAEMVELKVLRSPEKEEYVSIRFYVQKGGYKGLEYQDGSAENIKYKRSRYGLISLETSMASTLADVGLRPPETAPVLLEKGEPLKLRVFVDKSVVEVFVNDKQCIATRVFPGLPESKGISFLAKGGSAKITKATAYKMKSIYN